MLTFPFYVNLFVKKIDLKMNTTSPCILDTTNITELKVKFQEFSSYDLCFTNVSQKLFL